ncbi:MAG: aminotransferase class IV [Saprospiraceae bacterium]|nr:aminotransferase class IV [Saprospiraceae bacterium]
MPTTILNGRVLDDIPEHLEQVQRALFYGDVLFETIRVFDGKMPLLTHHWARMSAGLTALGFEIPTDWDATFFGREILRIAPRNARVRLTVWRSLGGKYAPTNDLPQYLITVEAYDKERFEWLENGLHIGICTSARLPVDAFSGFKTLNAPRYVAAAREARTNGWDDALLLNMHGRVCEATSSNVFWWERDTLCTVPLSEGCVSGVFRSFLINWVKRVGEGPVSEKVATLEDLMAADEIFLTNAVRGIIPVRIFAGQNFPAIQTKQLFSLLDHALLSQQQ